MKKLKELKQFDKYFGQKVDYSFLKQDTFLKLSDAEEENLKEGAVLRTVKGRKQVVVGAEITSAGGQGIIYKKFNDEQYVIKLYRREARTKHTEQKIKRMIEFKNPNKFICWPIDAVETEGGVFVGFIMPKVEGKNLYSLTTRPKRVMKNYPQFDRVQQVDMILQTLELFKFLHGINVIVGDVKLENVMFDNDFNITVIDIDSVQLEQFPCESSTPGYDAPEVILSRGYKKYDEKLSDGTFAFNRYYRDYYRTLEIESFSLSVLLYRFLMNGTKPYDYADYGQVNDDKNQFNDNELCAAKKFAYSLSSEETYSECREKNIWSHFPSFLKEAFVDVFSKGKRYTDDEWIMIFARYKKILDSGELYKIDLDCKEAFPTQQVDYNTVKFRLSDVVEANGFSMSQVVSRIAKELESGQIKKRMLEIANVLKQQPEYTVDNYRFSTVYNIGILKKIKCEYLA